MFNKNIILLQKNKIKERIKSTEILEALFIMRDKINTFKNSKLDGILADH